MAITLGRLQEGPVSMAGAGVPPPLAPELLHPPRAVQTVLRHLGSRNEEYGQLARRYQPAQRLNDFLFATPLQPHDPAAIFERLRWGGLFVFATSRPAEASELARQFQEFGFSIEDGPSVVRQGFFGLPIPLLSQRVYYFAARKVSLLGPGDDTDRFTYHVTLQPSGDPAEPWVVQKEVPSIESVVVRLARRFPDISLDIIEKRARKFSEKIFPTFLTREAAFLKILQERLPVPYNRRVPRCTYIEKDERGFVRMLRMNWLRVGGPVLSQMEFARQSADLLRVVHDVARVIHLDLRLDNFVITPDGVGFVDFGSAVRDGENLDQNPLLYTLFDELMRTSHIQLMLEKMTASGEVTSKYITRGYQRVDKAVDYFFLAVQFNQPHNNPDLAGLIRYEPDSGDAMRLQRLTEEILRPADPDNPLFRSAKDILHGIERVALKLDEKRRRRSA